MAITKVSRGLLSTGVSDSSDATAITIDSSERVGIGTTNPPSKLTVSGSDGGKGIELQVSTGSVQYLMAYDRSASDYIDMQIDAENLRFGTNTGSERMRITSDGKVGIGTTSPSSPLHIERASSETNLIVQSNIGGSGSSIGGRLRLQLGAQSNTGSGNADTQAGDTLGQIMFEGQGTDYSFQGGNIKCVVQTGDGNDNRSNQGTYMSFETINVGSASPAERMRIDQAGNIGAPSGTNIYNASDARLKQNINSLTDGLNIINNLNPVSFNWVDNFSIDEKDKTLYGFVAQEVQDVFPDAIENFSNGNDIEINGETIKNPLTVREKFLVPVLVKAIQEQQEIIDDLKGRIEVLEA